MVYVDGFVLPVPKKNLVAYRNMARKAARVWLDHGALEFRECVGDDLEVKMGRSYLRQLGVKKGETVVFSWITFTSRAQRDRVNAAVMKDPRMNAMGSEMPFDVKRMMYGGFRSIVDAGGAKGRASGPSRAARRPGKGRGRGAASEATAPAATAEGAALH